MRGSSPSQEGGRGPRLGRIDFCLFTLELMASVVRALHSSCEFGSPSNSSFFGTLEKEHSVVPIVPFRKHASYLII